MGITSTPQSQHSRNSLEWPEVPPLSPIPTISSRVDLTDADALIGKVIALTPASEASARRYGLKTNGGNLSDHRILLYVEGIAPKHKGGVSGQVLKEASKELPHIADLKLNWTYLSGSSIWCPTNELLNAAPAENIHVASQTQAVTFLKEAKAVHKRREIAERKRTGVSGRTVSEMVSSSLPAVRSMFEGLKLPSLAGLKLPPLDREYTTIGLVSAAALGVIIWTEQTSTEERVSTPLPSGPSHSHLSTRHQSKPKPDVQDGNPSTQPQNAAVATNRGNESQERADDNSDKERSATKPQQIPSSEERTKEDLKKLEKMVAESQASVASPSGLTRNLNGASGSPSPSKPDTSAPASQEHSASPYAAEATPTSESKSAPTIETARSAQTKINSGSTPATETLSLTVPKIDLNEILRQAKRPEVAPPSIASTPSGKSETTTTPQEMHNDTKPKRAPQIFLSRAPQPSGQLHQALIITQLPEHLTCQMTLSRIFALGRQGALNNVTHIVNEGTDAQPRIILHLDPYIVNPQQLAHFLYRNALY
jgi:hypothetical protein